MVRQRLRPRVVIAVLLLAVQVVFVAVVHLGGKDWRYFAWAPNDYLVTYDVDVTVDGRPLPAPAVDRRYRIGPDSRLTPERKAALGLSRESRYISEAPPRHLFYLIEQYERTYGAGDHAAVAVTYQLNGHRERRWRWPR